mmetsp:Transcript_16126/g.19101  ORF Transcript_16126/g.19101 Transcript_16126/m.19101 type:complete len:512 (-) Transcript_16126:43-1578(-)
MAIEQQHQIPVDYLDDENNDNGPTPYVSFQLEEGDTTRMAGAAAVTSPSDTVLMMMGNDRADDDDDNNSQMDRSIILSVATADGIHDRSGFYIVCLVILIGDMSRGAMFPSMWPLVQELGGSQVTLGYSVAAFSFGRILVNPIFGSWSVTYGYAKTLKFAVSILLIGEFFYSQVQNVGHTQFLIVAQTILGIGSGTLGVTRAFVADVTAKRHRTTYMAWITAVQYGGFTVTPFFGALFNKVLQDNDFKYGFFRLNMYTAPAYFMAVITIFTLIMMKMHFPDRQRIETQKNKKGKSSRRTAMEDHANQKACSWLCPITIYDCCILGCMLLNLSTKGSIASFETLGISFANTHFDLESSYAGAVVGTCGSCGVIALLSMGYLVSHFSDIQLISGGMMIMALGIISLSQLEEGDDNPTWRYWISIFMIYSIGYPIGHTAVIGLFSKIVGRRPQGMLLGWFASAGSLARMIFPITSGYIAHFNDVSTLFYLLTCVLIVSSVFVICSREILKTLSS